MEGKANRYLIMMFWRNDSRFFKDQAEYENFEKMFDKYNENQKMPFVCGNLKLRPDSLSASFTVYKKITEKTTLEELVSFSTSCKNQDEIKEKYANQVAGGKGKLYFGYMYNGLKKLAIPYEEDRVYANYDELINLMIEKALEKTFLAKIWTNKDFTDPTYRKNIPFYKDKIQKAYGHHFLYVGGNLDGIHNAIRDFMRTWCTHNGEIDVKRVMEAGAIVKRILNKLEKSKNFTEGNCDNDQNGELCRKKTL